MKKQILTLILFGSIVWTLCARGNKEQNNNPTLEVSEIENENENESQKQSENVSKESSEMVSESTEELQTEDDNQISQAMIDDVKQMMSTQEALAAELSHSINFDNLSQAELNDKSAELYEVWDFALNSLWNTLKKTLSEEEMNALTIEEREWVEMKEQAVKESGAQFEGGSIYPLIVNLKAVELTKERVYELLQLIIPLDTSSFIGEYYDYDVNEPNLEIRKNEDETYTIQIGIYRLASIDDGVGNLQDDKLVFSATDPGGKPLEGYITLDGKIATVTFVDSEWEYFSDKNEYQYYKTSDTPFIYE